MKASEGCRAYFLSELFGGVSEGVHAEPFFSPGWSTRAVATLRRVGLWLVGWEVRGVYWCTLYNR